MTEQEFLDLVNSCTITYYKKGTYDHDFKWRNKKDKPKVNLDDDYLYVEWVSGGVSGGSCWDDEGTDPHHPMSGEQEEELDDLDTILTEICPTLTFLQYKQISKIINYDSRTENEYYGNSTVYSYKYIKLRDLYNKLKEMKLI